MTEKQAGLSGAVAMVIDDAAIALAKRLLGTASPAAGEVGPGAGDPVRRLLREADAGRLPTADVETVVRREADRTDFRDDVRRRLLSMMPEIERRAFRGEAAAGSGADVGYGGAVRTAAVLTTLGTVANRLFKGPSASLRRPGSWGRGFAAIFTPAGIAASAGVGLGANLLRTTVDPVRARGERSTAASFLEAADAEADEYAARTREASRNLGVAALPLHVWNAAINPLPAGLAFWKALSGVGKSASLDRLRAARIGLLGPDAAEAAAEARAAIAWEVGKFAGLAGVRG